MSFRRRIAAGLLATALTLLAPMAVSPANAAPTVSANSAGTTTAGIDSYTWGTASGAPNSTVWTEAQFPDGSWVRSQVRKTNSSGGYSIPLTYASNVAGTVTWRVAVSTSGGIVRSAPFTLTRVGRVTATNVDPKPVGDTTYVWGTAHGAPGQTVWTEARLSNGTWARSQVTTANASGGYAIPLTYGANTAGTTNWRVAAVTPLGVVRSSSFTLTRTGYALDLSRETSWIKIAECESGNNWSINTGNGYYGGLQFNYATWHSVDGGDFANYPHQATREEQITVANRLYEQRGFQPWTCRRVL